MGKKAHHEDERNEHGLAIAKPLRNNAVQGETEDLADECAVGQASLPSCRDVSGAVWKFITVGADELGEAIERADQYNVEAYNIVSGVDKTG